VAVAPGWQAQTDYSYRLGPNDLLDVGLLWWWPLRDKVEIKKYPWPAAAVEEINLAEPKRKARAAA
jgi:hypothetical protein